LVETSWTSQISELVGLSGIADRQWLKRTLKNEGEEEKQKGKEKKAL
jgi:hypothetical protein